MSKSDGLITIVGCLFLTTSLQVAGIVLQLISFDNILMLPQLTAIALRSVYYNNILGTIIIAITFSKLIENAYTLGKAKSTEKPECPKKIEDAAY